jgi:hypothetical protein
VSYADAPALSLPVHAALLAASNTAVPVLVAATFTAKGSQELVALPLLEVRLAWKL